MEKKAAKRKKTFSVVHCSPPFSPPIRTSESNQIVPLTTMIMIMIIIGVARKATENCAVFGYPPPKYKIKKSEKKIGVDAEQQKCINHTRKIR